MNLVKRNTDGSDVYQPLKNVDIPDAEIAQSKVINLTTDLGGKAPTAHPHTISNVTGLQTALDGKTSKTLPFTSNYIPKIDGAGTGITNSVILQHSNNNIGIGVPTPAFKLDIAGTLNAMGTISQNSTAVCLTNDARLTNARTPTAHTHAESEITNLVSDLAGKASTTHATAHKLGGSDSIRLNELDLPSSNVNFNYKQLENACQQNVNNVEMAALGVALGSSRQGAWVWNIEEGKFYGWDGYSFFNLSGNGIPYTIFNAKGDLLVGTANDTAAILTKGADGLTLIADSTQTTGLRWGSVTGVGEANTASNVNNGGGSTAVGLYKQKSGVNLELKSLKGQGRIGVLTSGVSEINVITDAELNTASNLGTGIGVYHNKVGEDLRFNSLKAGDGVGLTTAVSGEILISQSGSFGTISSFADLNFSFDNRVLYFTGNGNDNLLITAIPDGVDCKIVISANGGDVRLDFPTGDFVQGGLNQIIILNNTAIIINVVSISNRAYWTYSNAMTQI